MIIIIIITMIVLGKYNSKMAMPVLNKNKHEIAIKSQQHVNKHQSVDSSLNNCIHELRTVLIELLEKCLLSVNTTL